MASAVRTWSVGDLAKAVGGEVRGDSALMLTGPAPAGSGGLQEVTFAGDEKHLALALKSDVGVVLVSPEVEVSGKTSILVVNPRQAFGMVLALFQRPLPIHDGVHPTAVISNDAILGPDVRVGPYAVVEAYSHIGAGARIHAHSYIGDNCRVGEGTVIYPHVTIYQDVTLGKRCVIHSGAVIGADGFGFVWDGEKRQKVPQVGGLEIGDDVEVGANTCIDRATAGRGNIGNGVKLDNLVQVGHNVTLGDHTVLAAQVGISGSSTLGARVVMGGQAGMADHMHVTDDVVLGGRSGVISDIKEPGEYFGLPAVPFSQAMRNMALLLRLPELFKRVRALERGQD